MAEMTSSENLTVGHYITKSHRSESSGDVRNHNFRIISHSDVRSKPLQFIQRTAKIHLYIDWGPAWNKLFNTTALQNQIFLYFETRCRLWLSRSWVTKPSLRRRTYVNELTLRTAGENGYPYRNYGGQKQTVKHEFVAVRILFLFTMHRTGRSTIFMFLFSDH